MTVIIPLAGLGTRLRPLTHSIPKALLPVAGETVISWIFKSLSSLPIDKIILIIGYKGHEIKKWVKENHTDFDIRWVNQREMKGLGHAIWIGGKEIPEDEDVLIYLGDTIFNLDWQKIKEGGKNYIGVRKVKDPRRFGVVELKNGKISGMVEKPENPVSDLAIVGLYYIKDWGDLYSYLNNLVEREIKTEGEYQLTDGLELMMKNKDIIFEPICIDGWFDCGTIDSLLKTNAELIKRFISENDYYENKESLSYVHKSCRILDSVIGPYTSIGEDSKIINSKVKNSIIGNNVRIENSEINDSIIGNGVEMRNSRGVYCLASDSLIIEKEEN